MTEQPIRPIALTAEEAARALSISRNAFDAEVAPHLESTGSYIDHSATTKAYHRARRAAGLRRLRFHDLRHSFGTQAVQEYPLTDVKTWMGHSDIATTMRYVHYVPKHEAAERLGRLLGDENVAPKLAPNSREAISSEGGDRD